MNNSFSSSLNVKQCFDVGEFFSRLASILWSQYNASVTWIINLLMLSRMRLLAGERNMIFLYQHHQNMSIWANVCVVIQLCTSTIFKPVTNHLNGYLDWLSEWTILTACLTVAGALTGSGISSGSWLPVSIGDMTWCE